MIIKMNDKMTQAKQSKTPKEVVILVHGHWGHPWVFLKIEKHLKRLGFDTHTHAYSSLRHSPMQVAQQLKARIDALDAPVVHLVGHSLGGVVILNCLAAFDDVPKGKVVNLGSPYLQSRAAIKLAARHRPSSVLGRILIGKATDGALIQAVPQWRGQRPLAVLAGDDPKSVGVILRLMDSGKPHDGLIYVDETVVDNATAHRVFHASHTLMLFNDDVVESVGYFLQMGKLPRLTSDCKRDG